MAWISVHQQVNGAKLRSLAKRIGCSRHEALGILVVLWMWGLDNASEDGFIINADEDDVADAITIGLSSNLNPNEVVDALIKTGWIDCVEHRLMLHDWDEWQAPWYKFREKRQKETERKRDFRRRQSSASSDQPSAPPTPPPTPATPSLGDELTDDDIAKGQELETKVLPGIESVCRECGMKGFTVRDEKTVRELLLTYSADEICVAVSKAAKQGKVHWAYIEGILKNGGGKRDDGTATGRPSPTRARHGGSEDRPGRYGLESTKI